MAAFWKTERGALLLLLGVTAVLLTGLVLLPHLLAEHRYKRHINLRMMCALLAARPVAGVAALAPNAAECALAGVGPVPVVRVLHRQRQRPQLLRTATGALRPTARRLVGQRTPSGTAGQLVTLVQRLRHHRSPDAVDTRRGLPGEQWQLVLVEADNKVPMYLQNGGKPFSYVAETQNFPRQGDSAAFIAWLEKTSGKAFDPQRTIIVAQYAKDDPTPLAYLGKDHRVIGTQPDNGERWFHKREDGSVAFVPERR